MRLPALAVELVQLKREVIMTQVMVTAAWLSTRS